MQPHLVIFDWDGTLMDSVGRIVSSMQATARYINLPVPTANAIKDIIGMSLEPAIKQLFGPLPVAQHKAFLARYRDEYVDLNTTPTPLFESVTEVLTALKQEQHVIAVATGKARRGLDRVWQETAMHDVFASSRCADESESKPHPKMLYELMTELQFLPQQTVMVGDSVHDMRMAKAAGVTAIGVDFGVHDSNRLTAAGADIVISKLQQLPPFIKQLTDTRQ